MSADEVDPKPEDKPESSAMWLAMLKDAEVADRFYHEKVDNIEKLFADLKAMAAPGGDRELQLLWANMEVMKPTVYSRPPNPLASPRFKDRKELPRRAADLIERAMQYDADADDLHETLLSVRDDMCVCARGVVWVTDGGEDGSPAPAEHLDRKDWRCEPARKWAEVGWVARRAYMTRKEVKARFGKVPPTMKFVERKVGDFKGEKKASVWELWDRGRNCVVWVSEDVQDVLDKRPPHLKLTKFFPCPKPAYATLERGTLTPIPDTVYYLDQIEEINDATDKIANLTAALRLRGFYPAGASDIGQAIEQAWKATDHEALLTPINTMASLGPAVKMGDVIAWTPLVEVFQAIQGLVEIRRQLIEDVYQITGLSDIMRGATDPNETLGAQQLKSQYGSVRIKEKQAEMQRVARDVIRIKAEIMAENVSIDALLEMAQVDDLPRQADIEKQAQQIQAQAQQAVMGVIRQAMQPPPPPQGMPPQGAPQQGMPMQ